MSQIYDPGEAEKVLFNVVVGQFDKQVRSLVELNSFWAVSDALFERLHDRLLLLGVCRRSLFRSGYPTNRPGSTSGRAGSPEDRDGPHREILF